MAVDFSRYQTYDPDSEGYGNSRQWRDTFYKKMSTGEAIDVLKNAQSKPHQILGVSQTASPEEIKKVFRKLVMQWHPDRNPDKLQEAEEMTKKIIAAYTILTQ